MLANRVSLWLDRNATRLPRGAIPIGTPVRAHGHGVIGADGWRNVPYAPALTMAAGLVGHGHGGLFAKARRPPLPHGTSQADFLVPV
jgi:hypothetical protein